MAEAIARTVPLPGTQGPLMLVRTVRPSAGGWPDGEGGLAVEDGGGADTAGGGAPDGRAAGAGATRTPERTAPATGAAGACRATRAAGFGAGGASRKMTAVRPTKPIAIAAAAYPSIVVSGGPARRLARRAPAWRERNRRAPFACRVVGPRFRGLAAKRIENQAHWESVAMADVATRALTMRASRGASRRLQPHENRVGRVPRQCRPRPAPDASALPGHGRLQRNRPGDPRPRAGWSAPGRPRTPAARRSGASRRES